MGCSVKLWGVGALDGTGTCLIDTRTIDVIFSLDDVPALRHHIEVIVRGIVAWGTVGASVIATHLIDGFQTGGTLVNHLYEVVVAVCLDGDADGNAVSDFIGVG